ncbi:MAG: ATP-dependent Clp protease proteolytic subunit, partial [Frankiales bacterium]|nr:ATP-dependent Clp protease proteolytic subunit [Frankiales bacterium]
MSQLFTPGPTGGFAPPSPQSLYVQQSFVERNNYGMKEYNPNNIG